MQRKTIIALLIGLFAVAVLGGAALILQGFESPLPPAARTAETTQDRRAIETQIEAYQSLIAENPNDPRYHQGLGNLYWKLREWEGAAEHLGRALKLSPEENELRVMVAIASWHSGRTEDGIAYLQEAVRRDPSDPVAQLYLGMLLAGIEGRESEAIVALERAIALSGDGELTAQARQMLVKLRGRVGADVGTPVPGSDAASAASPEEPVATSNVSGLFPESLAGLELKDAYGGARAVQEIERLHGGKLSLEQGYVAYYAGAGRSATFWISEAADETEAAELLEDMRSAIAKGGTPFSAPEPLEVPGLESFALFATQGMGQFHYFWAKKRLVIWVALDDPDQKRRQELLKMALVFVG